ncbi:pyridoxal phosphate-dependent aminotransferase [Romboutsia sp. 1001216sp1]|uniref:pyridoxal phosphate-dependent aminotransferase n=1 Tax=Romboutsia sp. 1001216sp1 TaxID=2986997 RepID=UPI00232B05A1|nr:pyridoxal phosphate-dependent aminotransferase [Romboutsia sp. 1001216sp1]MDB8804340.1 pyridoxal phosphate-dependent aminotransferase [Romboutsia sp. 1001216sp1]MDB8807702.1 pyridoxal phosphate-dependent aminotransferase [Romboutsia sp. 1001216sp1]MDB8809986.1 pyridoxal phosphate-dependent aminotransferase [Romboutsia sp. 1001216sp1]MDB8815736.1 pyridoxal phosphate-dependent aminotransferase [Romboutsia sp. 1001216sp1]MDB8819416.1 pyridoxal phosphate-dependent aminotransferase [Romboutsia s
MKYSQRVSAMQSSPIRKLVPYALDAKSRGIKVYHLNIGQPDIKTPKGFFEAVKNFDSNVLEYAVSNGIPELIKSLQDYYTTYDMHFDKDEILITNGGSEAILFTLMAICDPGDNIIVPEPFYTNYNGFSQCINIEVNPITTKAERGFHLPSKEEITSRINSKTKGILLSNPGNPTGTVYTKEEIDMIGKIAIENNLWIIADEVYREFVYDGLSYTSFGNVKEIEDRVVIIDSVSKRYSACGARIGSIASKNKGLIAQILKLCQGRLCVPTLEQIGSVELYKTPTSYFKEVNEEYRRRRDVLYNELMKVDGVVCKKPTGAFYIVAKLPVENAEDFVIWMLKDFNKDNETVMVCPAEGFYSTEGLGRDEIRLAYILNEDDLLKAASILKEGLEKYVELKKSQLSSADA